MLHVILCGFVIVLYCIVLYCPVLHYSTLPPGINPFADNNNNNNNNNIEIYGRARQATDGSIVRRLRSV